MRCYALHFLNATLDEHTELLTLVDFRFPVQRYEKACKQLSFEITTLSVTCDHYTVINCLSHL